MFCLKIIPNHPLLYPILPITGYPYSGWGGGGGAETEGIMHNDSIALKDYRSANYFHTKKCNITILGTCTCGL